MKRVLGLPNLMRAERGVTMTEVLVTCAVLAMVVGAVYTLLIFGEQSWRATAGGAEAQSNARLGIERVIKDLRSAQAPGDGSQAIPLASSNEISFYRNTDTDTDSEKVRYFVRGHTLVRGITDYTQAGYSGKETEEEIAEGVRMFSLGYADINSDPFVPRDRTGRDKIRLVTVSLQIDADPQAQPPAVHVHSVASLRNLSFAD